jgi:hypothetical protein
MKIDYSRLMPGTIIGTASYCHPISLLIREGETWDWRALFNSKIATHTLIVVKEHDLLYGIEMTPPKIHQRDLSTLSDSNIFGDHMVFAATPQIVRGDHILQEYISKWLLKLHYLGVLKYDWRGLFQFPLNKLQDILGLRESATSDSKKYYCSEFVNLYLKTLETWTGVNLHLPNSWNSKVSPWDIQKFCKDQLWTTL